MNVLAQNTKVLGLDSTEEKTVSLTLYDLIETINNEVEPGEEEFVTAVVLDLIESGKVKWARSP